MSTRRIVGPPTPPPGASEREKWRIFDEWQERERVYEASFRGRLENFKVWALIAFWFVVIYVLFVLGSIKAIDFLRTALSRCLL